MGRHRRQGLIYFPLDTDFFVNKKMKAIRRAHGSTGLLTYLCILTKVYQNGYYYKFDDFDEFCMDIAEEIACKQLRSTATGVAETIRYLVGQKILDEGLFKKNVISGQALQEQYVLCAYRARRIIEMDVYCLVDINLVLQKNGISSEEKMISSEEIPVSSEEGAQSESKSESKRKESITDTHSIARACGIPDNVVLTPQQYRDLCERIPDANAFIRRFAWRIAERGYTYSDHHAAILSWWEKDQSKLSQQGVSTPSRDSSFETDTFAQIAMKQSLELAKRKEKENNGKI